MKRVGELFVIAAPVLLGFANVVEAASSPLVWSCSGDGYECSIRYGRGYCSDRIVCWPEIRLTGTSDSMSPSAEGFASVTLERSGKKAEGMEASYRLVCGSNNWFRDDGGPSNVSSVVKLRLFRNETILLSLTNAEDSASIEFDLWKDVVSLARPQARLLPLYFARQSCFRDDGRRMEVRSCLAVGNSKMYYVFRVGEKGECGHVVASADDDRIADIRDDRGLDKLVVDLQFDRPHVHTPLVETHFLYPRPVPHHFDMEKIDAVWHVLQFRQALVVREGEMVDRRILAFRQVHRSERHRLGIGGVHDRDLHLRELPHHAVREDDLGSCAEGHQEGKANDCDSFVHSEANRFISGGRVLPGRPDWRGRGGFCHGRYDHQGQPTRRAELH